MKLLYSGSTFCDEPVLKRLLVVAEEIHFMDRPSVTFGGWGTIGHHSLARRIDSSGSPVLIGALSPPSGPGDRLYNPYIEADINNPEFASIVLDGIQYSDEFALKFIQFEANYRSGIKGKEIVQALRTDCDLLENKLDLEVDGTNMFDVSSHESRRNTFKIILIEASINITSTVILAEESGIIPVSEDSYIIKLIASRASDSAYVGGTSKISPYIGLDVVKAVIPDELLKQITIPEILKYREKAKDAYTAWSTEINRVAAGISNIDGITTEKDEIARVIAADLMPQIVEYRNDMCAIRDDLFSDLLKKIVTWEVPSLSLAYLANLGFAGAIALFASALTPAIPDAVDYFKEKRNLERRNAMSFLIRLSRNV